MHFGDVMSVESDKKGYLSYDIFYEVCKLRRRVLFSLWQSGVFPCVVPYNRQLVAVGDPSPLQITNFLSLLTGFFGIAYPHQAGQRLGVAHLHANDALSKGSRQSFCPYCYYHQTNSAYVSSHVRKVHYPYLWLLCGLCFKHWSTSSDGVRKHMKDCKVSTDSPPCRTEDCLPTSVPEGRQFAFPIHGQVGEAVATFMLSLEDPSTPYVILPKGYDCPEFHPDRDDLNT